MKISNTQKHSETSGNVSAGSRRLRAPASSFTLIEMLVVIAIIGILAALVLSLGPLAAGAKIRHRVKTELAGLETVIESYKEARGFYPPDNPNNTPSSLFYTNSLCYELTGRAMTNELTGLLDPPLAREAFGVDIVNAAGISDDVRDFHQHLKDSQVFTNNVGRGAVRILGIRTRSPLPPPFNDFAPWQYRLAPQTNDPSMHHPNSYDLWVIVQIGGSPKTFGNWRD